MAPTRCRPPSAPAVLLGLLALTLWGGAATAAEVERVKMPEPILGESVTDLDSTTAGELEFDLTGAVLTIDKGWRSSVEAEWRALPRLGLAVEASTAGTFASGLSREDPFGIRVAGSFALVHDLAHDFHLQAEASGRVMPADGYTQAVDPGDTSLPLSLGLRAGIRRGLWTLRAGLGGEALGHSAHLLPVWASLAGLVGLGPEGRLGFAGLEVEGDWARAAPFLLAPTATFNVAPFQLPIKIGAAFPIAPPQHGGPVFFSALLRIMVETDTD